MFSSFPHPHRLRLLRFITGAIFILAGFIKLAMPLHGTGFGDVLATLAVPDAALAGIAVPLVEIIGGFALLVHYRLKLFVPLLAIDMAFAIALIGIPGRWGHTVRIAQHQGPPLDIGSEFWRLPLEVGLLIVLILVLRQENRKNSPLDRPICNNRNNRC